MAVAAITTVALSLAILGGFLLLALSSHRFVEGQLAKFQIAASVRREASVAQAEEVRDTIKALPLTKSVKLLSRDSEWAKMKPRIGLKMDLGGIIDNPLPYMIEVTSKDPRKVSDLAEQIRRIDGVKKVRNAEEDYKRVRTIADLVKALGVVGAVILCITTVFIISNAIRLTLFARRHEIRIMQLVGATNWFIRAPLVLEGIVLGAIGALVATALVAAGSGYTSSLVWKLIPATVRNVSSGIDQSHFAVMLIIGGAAIGALGSMVSIRRFLKV